MCGFVGFDGEDDKTIRSLTGLLRHRGPDAEGFHVGGGVSLGHRRLKIIDLSENAAQPLFNEDRTVCVVHNGEVFNFLSLREDLIRQGHVFRSKSDAEVLVHGYEQWGIGLLARLIGQFAFCLFDRRAGHLVLARDPLGIKPLYYYSGGRRFIFGSEMKIFFKSDLPERISREALDYYALFGATPESQSILEGVRKVQPGSFLVYDLASRAIAEQGAYWSLRFAPDDSMSEAEAADQVRQRLGEAVRSQLVGDVPLGAFLSGGLDSSAIVALARPLVKELNTFSIRFDRPGYDESAHAKIVSDLFGTIHHEIRFDARTVRDLIDDLPFYYDEPFADPSMIAACLVSRVARRYATVSLSGTGGDELFAGYPRYREIQILRRLNALPGPIKRLLALGVDGIKIFAGSGRLDKLRSFLGSKQKPWETYLKLFSPMFRRRDEPPVDLARFSSLAESFTYGDAVTDALNFDTLHYLPECLLVKEDRASMAVGLETRVPFLDHTLAEFAATLPARLKLKGREKKYILKKAFRGILPDRILFRRKQGFGVPLADYFREELKDFAEQELFGNSPMEIYDRDFLARAWRMHLSGKADYSRLFWTVLMFNLWYRRWMA